MSSLVSTITGSGGARAARQAGNIQADAAERAIQEQSAAGRLAREDYKPYREAGRQTLSGLQGLVNDPKQQLSFIENNPFFRQLSNQATSTLLKNQAARGKLATGDTAKSLQQNLLGLGTDLVNQSINQRLNLANLGLSATSGATNANLGVATNIGNLIQSGAASRAAGLVGAENARTNAWQSILDASVQVGSSAASGGASGASAGSSGAAAALSDVRSKTDIKKVGKLDNGLAVYLFRYKGESQFNIGVMAQEVEKVKPEAVIEIENLKHVNLEKACQEN